MSHVLHRSTRQSFDVASLGRRHHHHAAGGRTVIDARRAARPWRASGTDSSRGCDHPSGVRACLRAHVLHVRGGRSASPTRRGHEPGGLSHAYFVVVGFRSRRSVRMKMQAAFVERGEPDRVHIIARRQSYHGNTFWRALRGRVSRPARVTKDAHAAREPRGAVFRLPSQAGGRI